MWKTPIDLKTLYLPLPNVQAALADWIFGSHGLNIDLNDLNKLGNTYQTGHKMSIKFSFQISLTLQCKEGRWGCTANTSLT